MDLCIGMYTQITLKVYIVLYTVLQFVPWGLWRTKPVDRCPASRQNQGRNWPGANRHRPLHLSKRSYCLSVFS